MEPISNENETSSPLQRILIGIGTLIVIVLTVIAAIFLATQEDGGPGEETTTIIAQVTATATNTAPLITPSFTPTTPPPPPPPTSTPTVTPIVPTEVPATATPTATTAPLQDTPTPVVVVVTATATPSATQQAPTSGCSTTPANWVEYTVQPGDTLNSLAERTNKSVFDLQQGNCLEAFTIQSGQQLFLPIAPPPKTETPTPRASATATIRPQSTPTVVAPVVSDVVPDRVDADANLQPVTITVLGRNFRPTESGFRVELRGPQSLQLALGDSRTDTSFDAIVPANLTLGTYDVIVTNQNGRAGVRESAFIIGEAAPTATPGPGPEITAVSNSVDDDGITLRLTITGRFFRPLESGFIVELQLSGGDLTVDLDVNEDEIPATDQSFDAVAPLDEFTSGDYTLRIQNPDGKFAQETEAYSHP